MSVRPIDMQVMIPKMTEVAKMHGTEDGRHLAAVMHGEAQAKQRVEAQMTRVMKREDARKPDIREKHERDTGKDAKKRRQGQGRGQGQGQGQWGGDGQEGGFDVKL
jgi:hypothetical protein